MKHFQYSWSSSSSSSSLSLFFLHPGTGCESARDKSTSRFYGEMRWTQKWCLGLTCPVAYILVHCCSVEQRTRVGRRARQGPHQPIYTQVVPQVLAHTSQVCYHINLCKQK
ncbi:hypothetical protein E2C01_051272 [Portunus trituberculatus]|uniref:Uncharacterized protein n=1 Tax=Portunus trituberculatus TaxID=210409 RepID=A0A5B7GI84_PORTR|nr:hypothetical protein [Portunus trituberculatus]